MRTAALSIVSLSLCAGPAAASEAPPRPALDNPAYVEPSRPWTSIDDAEPSALDPEVSARVRDPDRVNCRDRITRARERSGLPPILDREPASPDKPHLIYAVDRRQDGCSVMVMKGNPDDIRPLPGPVEGPIRMIPAESDQ